MEALSYSFTPSVVSYVFKGHQDSSHNQDESVWKAFQQFLSTRLVTYVSQDVVIQFLSYLFHARWLKPSTTAVNYVAFEDPMSYGFLLTLDYHLLNLLRKGFLPSTPYSLSLLSSLATEESLTQL